MGGVYIQLLLEGADAGKDRRQLPQRRSPRLRGGCTVQPAVLAFFAAKRCRPSMPEHALASGPRRRCAEAGFARRVLCSSASCALGRGRSDTAGKCCRHPGTRATCTGAAGITVTRHSAGQSPRRAYLGRHLPFHLPLCSPDRLLTLGVRSQTCLPDPALAPPARALSASCACAPWLRRTTCTLRSWARSRACRTWRACWMQRPRARCASTCCGARPPA